MATTMDTTTVVDALADLHAQIVHATDVCNAITYMVGRKLGDEEGKLPEGLTGKAMAQADSMRGVVADLESMRAAFD